MYNIKLGQVAILPPGPKRRKVKMTEQEIDSLFQELGYEKVRKRKSPVYLYQVS